MILVNLRFATWPVAEDHYLSDRGSHSGSSRGTSEASNIVQKGVQMMGKRLCMIRAGLLGATARCRRCEAAPEP